MVLLFLQLCVLFLLAILYVKNRDGIFLLILILLGSALPYSMVFSRFFYLYGFNVFDFFIVIVFLLLNVRNGGMKFSSCELNIVIIFLICLALSMYSNDTSFLYAMKDVKPILIVILSYCIFSKWPPAHTVHNMANRYWIAFIIFLVIKAAGLLYLNANGFLASNEKDDFYSSDPEMINRYADFSIVFAFILNIYLIMLTYRYNISAKTILVVSLSLLMLSIIASNRTYFIVSSLFIFVFTVRFNLITKIVVYGCGLLAFIFYSALWGDGSSARLLDIMDFDRVVSLLETRYSPFFELYRNGFTTSSILFGNGFGTTFSIPWFEYRDGVDIHSVFIDNFYMTLFSKVGLLGVLFIFVIFAINLSRHIDNCLSYIAIVSAFLLLFSTTSFWYQVSFSYFAICFGYFLGQRKQFIINTFSLDNYKMT